MRLPLLITALATTALTTGCGSSSGGGSCAVTYPLRVTPRTATVDSSTKPPANQVQFTGIAVATAPPGCPVPQLARAEYAAWTNPDPAAIQISSAGDSTNGTAVCLGPTHGAVTLTGLFTPASPGVPPGTGPDAQSATVQLTCQ